MPPESDRTLDATHRAISRAKAAGRREITPDDLLMGLLESLSRFGVVLLGPWTIDLASLRNGSTEPLAEASPKSAYSKETAALFDRASALARSEGDHRTDVLHLLAAYADETTGLMGRLKETHGFDGTAWRAALAGEAGRRSPDASGRSDSGNGAKGLLSPDEAAEMLGVHAQTVRGYIRNGKLPAYRLAGERAIRIRREDLLALLEPLNPDEAGTS